MALLSGELHPTDSLQWVGQRRTSWYVLRNPPDSPLSKFCLVLFPFSAVRGQQLTSSESVVKRQGEPVTLSCHVTGVSLTYLHWIRQRSGHGLEWIGRIDDGTGTIFAASLQGQFTITKDSTREEVYLNVKSLKPEDSALYYCAREAHWHRRLLGCTNTEPWGMIGAPAEMVVDKHWRLTSITGKCIKGPRACYFMNAFI